MGSEMCIRDRDVCVLFRKSSEGETLGKALRRHGIDFAFYKQKGLFTGREAKEILDLLEAVAHPTDHSRIAKVWLTRFLAQIFRNWHKLQHGAPFYYINFNSGIRLQRQDGFGDYLKKF